jgi:hypothetical protein
MRRGRLIAAAAVTVAAAAVVWFARREPAPSAAEQALGRVLPEVRFEGTPLDEALATLAKQGGASIVLDWPALESAGHDPTQRIDLRLRIVSLDRAMTHLLRYASSNSQEPLIHTVFQDRIVVTPAGQTGRYAYARVYDVRDIVVQSPESVGEQLDQHNCFSGGTDQVGAMTRREQDESVLTLCDEVTGLGMWDVSGSAASRTHALHGRLLVVTSWHGHRQIERLLDQLRHPIRAGGR